MMKRVLVLIMLALIILPPAVWADDEGAGFAVARVVLSRAVDEREPVGITNVFARSDGQAYCFLEVKEITKDTQVVFVWYFNDIETARVELPVYKGSRWRTYSSKRFGIREGQWRVDLLDAESNVLESLPFEVRSK